MAGAAQNLEVTYAGQNVFLDIKFFDGTTNELVDPDAIPVYSIYDPTDTLVVSGQGNKISLGYWEAVYFIPVQALLGTWKIVWNATVGGYMVVNNVETFAVNAGADKPQTEQIIIENQWLGQIKKVLAFPNVDFLLLKDDAAIKTFAVWPAMYEYFKKFPIKIRQDYAIIDELFVPFPDNQTYGCTYVSATDKLGSSGGAGAGSSFWDIVRFQVVSGGGNLRYTGVGSYGTRYNYNGLKQEYLRTRQVAETYSNLYGTFKYFVNHDKKQVEAFSATQAVLVIHWAKYSLNFADVKYTWLQDVIKLAQSYLLFHLAESQGLLDDSQQDKKINIDFVKTRAQELRDEVITNKWDALPDNIIIRN